jgi:hypothetical protein
MTGRLHRSFQQRLGRGFVPWSVISVAEDMVGAVLQGIVGYASCIIAAIFRQIDTWNELTQTSAFASLLLSVMDSLVTNLVIDRIVACPYFRC